MPNQPSRYPRREFLGRCAAIPLATTILTATDHGMAVGNQPLRKSLSVPKMPEADLAKEVESLLKLVDPQVIYRYVPLSEAKNAWPFWEQAGKAFVDQPADDEFQEALDALVDKGTVPAPAVFKRILDWVKQNEQARTLTDQGIARGALELPRATKSIRLSLTMDEPTLFRKLAQAKAFFACVCLHRGDSSQAVREAASVLTMGMILIRSECLVVDYLVALALLGLGTDVIYRAAMSSGVSDDVARAAIQSLASAKATTEDFKRACRVEFCRWFLPSIAAVSSTAGLTELAAHHVADGFEPDFKPTDTQLLEFDRCIQQIAAILEGHERPFSKEATIRLSSELHARFFAELDKPWHRRNRQLLEPLKKELAAWPRETEPNIWAMFGSGDNPDPTRKLTKEDLAQARQELRTVDKVFGKYMIIQGSSTNMGIGVEMQHARLEARRIRIALRLYAKKHGRLPAQLDALVQEKLLPEVPRDPYNGESFKYSADRRVIWSVGQEGKNEGALPEKDDPENPFDEDFELTWRIGTN